MVIVCDPTHRPYMRAKPRPAPGPGPGPGPAGAGALRGPGTGRVGWAGSGAPGAGRASHVLAGKGCSIRKLLRLEACGFSHPSRATPSKDAVSQLHTARSSKKRFAHNALQTVGCEHRPSERSLPSHILAEPLRRKGSHGFAIDRHLARS